jgi:hypothetical protein
MLKTIPKLNTSHISNFGNFCYGCGSLVYVPELDTSSAISCIQAFFNCGSLLKGLESISIPKCSYVYNGCSSMVDAGCFDFQNTCPRETRWKTSFGKWIAVAVGFLLAKSRLLPQHAISIACFLYCFGNHN